MRMAHSAAQTSWATTRDESREMMALWPDLVRDLTEAGRHLDIPDVTRWMAKVGLLCVNILQFFFRSPK